MTREVVDLFPNGKEASKLTEVQASVLKWARGQEDCAEAQQKMTWKREQGFSAITL